MSAFFEHNIARGSGGRRYKPRVEQKIVHQDQGPT